VAAVLSRVADYARGPLTRRLHAPAPPIAVRPPPRGMRSLVYLVDFAGLPRVVLRADGRWLRAARLAYNFRSFARLGLPVPRLLGCDLSPLTRLRWGFYVLAEEFVEGHFVDHAPDRVAAVRAAARALARFHSVTRRTWGWPGIPRLGSYRAYFLGHVAKRAANLARRLPQGQAERLNAWFREQAAAAPLGSPFALTHGRVNCGNFVVRPDGEATLLDLIEARYGSFCPDLVAALDRLCARDETLMSAFLREYFAARPPECRAAFEGSRTFFEASRAVGRASNLTRRLARATDPGEAASFRSKLHQQAARLSGLSGVDLTVTG